ncbi:MMPL family transporter [Rhodococcus qingshengii]|uniref:MMPL family transporter n=1 Tax=Rhodococcus qingshengii TaxID=334542 RepID=UPI001C211E67|nr:MMPL family transporter [Rhodococcus qingshengii]QXC43994.1 MMPL family transporter [Rhodococcus qingshengii]
MFASWGSIVYRARFTVIAVMVAGLLGLAAYGLSLQDHLSQSGWDDPGSESVEAAKLADGTFGRSTTGDVLALYTAPEGKTVDDPEFQAKVIDNLQRLVADNPDQIMKINGSYFKVDNGLSVAALADKTKQHAVTSIAIAGDNDTAVSNNFRDVESQFYIDGVDVQLAGLQPVANSLNDTMANDIKRMEMLAIPAVGVLLFFVFGGVVAAALPLIVGGLTVIGANGIIRLITNFTEVNAFVAPVVSLVGLGLAIDYGLFIVSRFREEIAEGYDTPTAVRRTVMTAGRTVMFSATMVAVSLGGLLLFPQGFLKSVAYGAIAAVMLAAISSITILPAILGILGKRIDALTFKKLRQTKTNEEIENGFWGKLTRWVMQHPLKVAVPIVAALLLMIIPLTGIKFGGINETYLPPDSPTRVAQAQFDELFPGNRTEPVRLVIEGADNTTLGQISKTANAAPGLVEKFTPEVATKDGVNVLKAGLTERNEARPTIDYLRSADWPEGTTVLVGGTPAIEQDSVDALLDRLPLMVVSVILLTTLLMFLTFGSLVLPIKAALMSALGLGSTLGILTWIFIDGHGSGLLNFTPGPIMSPVLVLIIAIVYGLSTDYEVFLLSRMVEARAQGASTTESIRIGTAHTGRIITAAALILIVVTGAFGLSDLVMMKYISYGMISALIIDATLIRMFLVPATMKLLGDDCWWAPAWMKRIQQKIGLGEPILDNELVLANVPQIAPVGAIAGPGQPRKIEAASRVMPPPAPAAQPESGPRVPDPLTEPIPLSEMAIKAPNTEAPAAEKPAPRRRLDIGSAASAPQNLIEAPIPNPSYRPQPNASDKRRNPTPAAPAERPIESWLSDLRAREQTPPASRPLPVVRTPSRTNGSATNGAASSSSGSNGASRNGSANGATNGSATNGSAPTSVEATPQLPPPPTAPERRNGVFTDSPSPTNEPRVSDATPDGDDNATGRHRPDDAGAISVSELIARQKRS